MSADTWAYVLLIAAAPPATLFPLIYGLALPWYRSLVGRALMTSSVGLGLLVDISLVYRVLGADYQARDVVRLTVFSVVTLGSYLQFWALVYERRKGAGSRFSDIDDTVR